MRLKETTRTLDTLLCESTMVRPSNARDSVGSEAARDVKRCSREASADTATGAADATAVLASTSCCLISAKGKKSHDVKKREGEMDGQGTLGHERAHSGHGDVSRTSKPAAPSRDRVGNEGLGDGARDSGALRAVHRQVRPQVLQTRGRRGWGGGRDNVKPHPPHLAHGGSEWVCEGEGEEGGGGGEKGAIVATNLHLQVGPLRVLRSSGAGACPCPGTGTCVSQDGRASPGQSTVERVGAGQARKGGNRLLNPVLGTRYGGNET